MCRCDGKKLLFENYKIYINYIYIHILNNLSSKQNDVQQLLKAYMCSK